MIGAHELLDPAIQELRYNWSYLGPDGTQGPSPFYVPPAPGMSVPSPLTEEQSGVLTPGTEHTWLFRVIGTRPGFMVRMSAVLVGSQESACVSGFRVSMETLHHEDVPFGRRSPFLLIAALILP